MEANKVKTYQIPKNEAGLVHAEITRQGFSPQTGKPLNKPFIQIFDIKEWHNFLEHPLGVTVTKILHLPAGAMTVEEFEAKKK